MRVKFKNKNGMAKIGTLCRKKMVMIFKVINVTLLFQFFALRSIPLVAIIFLGNFVYCEELNPHRRDLAAHFPYVCVNLLG